ncbi:nardilysin-like [Hydractinia symbiolongicarpus]|uniref:nardilysin-like n=1 Tax=Hydractinia symbiolongicarpus TaxID=13093 RepID=UPI0025512F01|nr:nardilysin-like [Hydractinia symbiolongicarpus]
MWHLFCKPKPKLPLRLVRVAVRKAAMQPVKSENDYREYRIITLENGIKATLVSNIKPSKNLKMDKNVNISKNGTKLAATALCIGTGGYNDPSNIPGLSHFLEHMVFMGSEKYPDENDFDVFISKHSGYDNATTDDERTTYEFEIQPGHLEEALKRFSQFFVSPLFKENSVEREIKAVDSEFKESLPDDQSRLFAIMACLARKDHPFSKFTTGNKISLSSQPKKQGINVMKQLREYFNKFYLATPVTLSISSTETLDTLESWARKYFSPLKARKEVIPLCNMTLKLDNPYECEQFHKLIYVTSVKETHELQLSWITPPTIGHYRQKPHYYASWLLGHECKGSVYSLLKNKGYIQSLNAFTESWSMMSLFYCNIVMTDKGVNNINEIIHTVFQYITLMHQTGPSEYVYKEMTKLDEPMFKYMAPEPPIEQVVSLAENMMKYEEKDYLRGSFTISEYNPELIQEYLNYLRRDNVNIIVLSKKFSHLCNEKEKWYKTKYAVHDIPSQWLDPEKCSKVNSGLHIPKENRFSASDFRLKTTSESSTQQYPSSIQENAYGKVWHKIDSKFLLPKVLAYFNFISPLNIKSSYYSACSELLDQVLDFNLAELCYEGESALLGADTSMSCDGFEIYFHGYNDKLQSFFQEYFNNFINMEVTDVAFNVSKEELIRSHKNEYIETDALVSALRLSVLESFHSNALSKMQELKKLTLQNFKDYIKEYLSQLYVESLFQGNITEQEAVSYQNYLYSCMETKKLPQEDFPKVLKLCLPKGRTVIRHYGFNKNDPNTAINNYYQIGHSIDMRLFMTAKLLDHIVSEPLFNILRTKEQLGYTIDHTIHYTRGVLGFSVTVETEVGKSSADRVDSKIDDFFVQFSTILKKYTEEEFEEYVTSFVQLLTEEDITLYDETNRNWEEISRNEYIFHRKEKMIEVAETISKEEVESFLHTYILDQDNVSVLCTQVIGHGDSADESMEEEDKKDSDNESDTSSDDDSDSDSSSDDEDCSMETVKGFQLVNVTSERYTRCVTNIQQFQKENSFFPHTVLKL